MSQKIEELIHSIKVLQEELEQEFDTVRDRFSDEFIRQQRRFKVGLFSYLLDTHPFVFLTAPIIYACLIPFVLLDLFLTMYQVICFPVYGIPKVKRREYFVYDRADLPYLNLIEKINCLYCSYGNGLMAYGHEIAARTEQYWCPIKHARRVKASHGRYGLFFPYGDAESYQKGLERLRRQYGGDTHRP